MAPGHYLPVGKVRSGMEGGNLLVWSWDWALLDSLSMRGAQHVLLHFPPSTLN